MPKVICFANMKGGVGKTTLCVSLGFELFRIGNKVLIVDNDPQFNASSALMSPQSYIDNCLKGSKSTIYHIYERPPRMRGRKPEKLVASNVIHGTWHIVGSPHIKLDLIPSQIELYETMRNPSQKEYFLDKFLATHANDYDYILIDCPPTPSVLTLSAFAASKYVVVPVVPDYFSTIGLPQFLGTLDDFKDQLVDSHDIKPVGVVFTKVPRDRDADTERSMDRVRKALKSSAVNVPVFDNVMSKYKVYEKTLWQSLPIHKLSGRGIRGKGAAVVELRALANELIAKINAM